MKTAILKRAAAAALACAAAAAAWLAASPARASAPPQCEVQRVSYCVWPMDSEVRLRMTGTDGTMEIEITENLGLRRTRIVEPWGCRSGAADTIPPYPDPAAVRRGADGWLHFTMRLRRDGRCDLQVSQQVPRDAFGTEYDRVMWLPIVICLGESLAAYPGLSQPFPVEFTRQGPACSLRYS
jgi:hypothetical protein